MSDMEGVEITIGEILEASFQRIGMFSARESRTYLSDTVHHQYERLGRYEVLTLSHAARDNELLEGFA